MENSKKDLNAKTHLLLNRARKGSADAFEDLYRLYSDRLAGAVRKSLGSRLRARMDKEDLVQSVWKDVLPDLDGFEYRGQDSFFRWLCARIIRKIQDKGRYYGREKRDAARETPIDVGGSQSGAGRVLPASDPTPSQAAMRRENVERLMQLLDHLPDNQRQTLVFRLRDSKTFEEIAGELGRSAGAVRQLYYRALRRIGELQGRAESEGDKE